MIRLVLFDVDGTLIRTGGAGVKAFGRTFASEFNLPNGTERISFAGRTDTGLVREFFRLHDIEPTMEHFERFFSAYVYWLDQLLRELRGNVCPGVRELIHEFRSLPEPPTLGLLTGNIRLGAEIKLRHYDLWDVFETGGFGDDHEDRNEIARIAHRRGSTRMGRTLHGDEVLVIGDTPLDIACANAISARCLAVATGGASLQQLKDHHPRWAVPDLKAVRAKDLCA
jgi:phosphoglycolate phosphatase-like HAD superfamily hydrolase